MKISTKKKSRFSRISRTSALIVGLCSQAFAQTPPAPTDSSPRQPPPVPEAPAAAAPQAPTSGAPVVGPEPAGSSPASGTAAPAAPSEVPSATALPAEPAEKTAVPPENTLSPVLSKFRLQLYGFVEFDAIEDSTQSFADLAGNALIARPGGLAADHPRTTFGARNSRLGLKVGGPGNDVVKTSGIVEMDFFGNQPGNPPAFGEGPFFTSPTFRIRHMAVKIETPIIDVETRRSKPALAVNPPGPAVPATAGSRQGRGFSL